MSNTITSLKKEGKLSEAYDRAISMLEQNKLVDKQDVWLTRAYAWVLHAQLKRLSFISNPTAYQSKLQEIFAAKIDIEEDMFWSSVAFSLRANLAVLVENNMPMALDLLVLVDFAQMSKSNGLSSVIKIVQKHFKEHKDYQSLIETIGFDKFVDEDFISYIPEGGRPIMSLVEQLIISYSKVLLAGQPDMHNPFVTHVDKEKVNTWIPIIDNLSRKSMEYPLYFKAKLLQAVGSNQAAIDCVIQFAKSNSRKFWVWTLLGDLHSNEKNLQKAYYSKAIDCGGDPKFLIGAMESLAYLQYTQGEFAYAKLWLEKVIKTKAQNGWKNSNKLNSMLNDPSIKEAIMPKDLKAYYKSLNTIASSLLYTDIEEEIVLITYVNKKVNIINFMKDRNDVGYCKYDSFDMKPTVGQSISIRRNKQSNDKKLTVVYSMEVATVLNPLSKKVTGKIKMVEGKSFGFINDIFCQSTLLPDGFREGNIEGLAIPSFDKKKDRWGYVMVNIINCKPSVVKMNTTKVIKHNRNHAI